MRYFIFLIALASGAAMAHGPAHTHGATHASKGERQAVAPAAGPWKTAAASTGPAGPGPAPQRFCLRNTAGKLNCIALPGQGH